MRVRSGTAVTIRESEEPSNVSRAADVGQMTPSESERRLSSADQLSGSKFCKTPRNIPQSVGLCLIWRRNPASSMRDVKARNGFTESGICVRNSIHRYPCQTYTVPNKRSGSGRGINSFRASASLSYAVSKRHMVCTMNRGGRNSGSG